MRGNWNVAGTTTQAAGVVVQTDNKQDDRICCRKLRCRSIEGADRYLQFMRQLEREGRYVQVQARLIAGDSMVASRRANALSRVTTTWYNFAMRIHNVATAAITGTQHGGSVLRGRDSSVLVEGNIHRDRGGSPVDSRSWNPQTNACLDGDSRCGCFHLLANYHECSNTG